MTRDQWKTRYRASRLVGAPRGFRHGPDIEAQAARLKARGSLADVDRSLAGALQHRILFWSQNAERALKRPESVTVAGAINLAGESRRQGGKALARGCVKAARLQRLKEAPPC